MRGAAVGRGRHCRYPGVRRSRLGRAVGLLTAITRIMKEFIRVAGMSHVRISPCYPQSNGKIERPDAEGGRLRPAQPATLEGARHLVARFVDHYNRNPCEAYAYPTASMDWSATSWPGSRPEAILLLCQGLPAARQTSRYGLQPNSYRKLTRIL
jgi:hypothetical protein